MMLILIVDYWVAADLPNYEEKSWGGVILNLLFGEETMC